jgi:hypothetical protein
MHAHSCVNQLLQAAINAVCFERGLLLIPIIETVTLPDGKIQPIAMHLPMLSQFCTAYKNDDVPFREIASGPLRWVMRDLVSALQPDMMTISCTRAIEGIRNLVSPTAKEDKQAWAEMHEKLRMEAFLQFISNSSTDHRHAKYKAMGGETTLEILKRSWMVMDRYLPTCQSSKRSQLPDCQIP